MTESRVSKALSNGTESKALESKATSSVYFRDEEFEDIVEQQSVHSRINFSDRLSRSWHSRFSESSVKDACTTHGIEKGSDGKNRVLLPSVQEYWYTYASWLACWPQVAEARNNALRFMDEWEQRANSSSGVQCFCVAHRTALRIRKTASWSEEECTGKYLHPGQCFVAAETVMKDQIRYLQIAGGSGWVFDKMDKITMCAKMENVEVGEWWYKVTTQNFIEVRSAPSASDDCRSGWIMCPKEVMLINLRCDINGHRYLCLADGRGWLFEKKPNAGKGSAANGEDLTVVCECSVEQQSQLAEQKRVTVELRASQEQECSKNCFEDATSAVRPTLSRKKGKKKAETQGEGKEPRYKSAVTSCFALCGRSVHY